MELSNLLDVKVAAPNESEYYFSKDIKGNLEK